MKNFKRIIAVALTAAMVAAIPAAAATEKATFNGYTKSGLERSVNGFAARYKENGKYVKRVWKKAKEYGTTYWFYFDSNTLCVRAKAYKNWVNNVACKSIGSKYYGFDMYGHRVSGVWATVPMPGKNGMTSISGKFWVFDEDGQYNKGKTKKLRALSEYLDRFDALKKVIGAENEMEETTGTQDFYATFGPLRNIAVNLFNTLLNTEGKYIRRYVYDTFEVYTIGIKQGKRNVVERIIAVTAVSKY
ncbi:MAG: hypothetical protein IJ899_20165 [Blautia sp.]|nr:hypothetical protein [Blautia sp.]